MPSCWPQKMGGKGEYAVFVGSLTVPLHNAWADAAIAYLGEKYPDMKLVGERYGVAEKRRRQPQDRARPDGRQPEPERLPRLSAARARSAPAAPSRSAARSASVHVLGPFSPGQGRELVKIGAITGGFMWNPTEAGRVFVTIGKMLVDGTEITDGTEIEGLGVVSPDVAGKDIITDNLIADQRGDGGRSGRPGPLSRSTGLPGRGPLHRPAPGPA